MANADIRQWPLMPLQTDKVEWAKKSAHNIAEAGPLILVCVIELGSHRAIWLENFRGEQSPYKYPNQMTETDKFGRKVIKIYPSHPMYRRFSTNEPIMMIEFWFSEEPKDRYHPNEPSAYLNIKSVA